MFGILILPILFFVSGGISMDWAIPQATRARYSQQFNATDRSRTGFLAGVQVIFYYNGDPNTVTI